MREERSGSAMRIVGRFLRDESGATAIEYGLIASLIAVTAIAAFQLVGTKMSATFNNAASKMKTAP